MQNLAFTNCGGQGNEIGFFLNQTKKYFGETKTWL